MSPTQLYQHLNDLAVKFDIAVLEQNLRVTGVNAKSGLCKIKEKNVFIMDKHLKINDKIEVLAGCLKNLPLDDIYVMPAIRKFLEKP